MRYTLLGNSGLRVSEVALGTMTFGTDWGFGASAGESAKQFELCPRLVHLRRAADRVLPRAARS
jgi:aryl-alcohol dehydrogenase-like predicted oxidoreductase